jgi:hypothetical protein
MSKTELAIAGRSEGTRLPTFEVYQLRCAPRWYVRVLWQYGQEQHITGFLSANDAQSWINKKSKAWLQIELRHYDHVIIKKVMIR